MRFNRSYRKGVLDKYHFETLEQVRIFSGEWMWKYNNVRIHDSLLDLTPRQFLLKYGKVVDFPKFQQDININNEFEKSGHEVPDEEAKRFNQTIIEIVKEKSLCL